MGELQQQVDAKKARLARFAEAAARVKPRQSNVVFYKTQPFCPYRVRPLESFFVPPQAAPTEPSFPPVSNHALKAACEVVTDGPPTNLPSLKLIQRIVCKHFKITRTALFARRRDNDHVVPRHVALYLAKQLTLRSLPDIGFRFGGYDHTTVLHAVRKIQKRIDVDEEFAAKVTAIRTEIEDANQMGEA